MTVTMHDNTVNMQENQGNTQSKPEPFPETEPFVPGNQPEQTQAPGDHSTTKTEQPRDDIVMAEAREVSSLLCSQITPYLVCLLLRYPQYQTPRPAISFRRISSPRAFTSHGGKESNTIDASGPPVFTHSRPYVIGCPSPSIRNPSSAVNHPT